MNLFTSVIACAALLLMFQSQSAGASNTFVENVGDPNCPHGGNYASVACLLPILDFDRAYIVESAFTNSTMFVPSYIVDGEGSHVNHSLWAYGQTPYGNCLSYVEQAYTYGWQYHNYYNYAFVRFDYDYPSQGAWRYQDWDDGLAYEGNPTKFQNQFDPGTGKWKVWRNDSLRWTYDNTWGTLGTGGACKAEAGLEVSKRPGMTGIESSYVSYTHNQNLAWYDTNMSLRNWGSAYNWIDYPCNQGQVPPNCLNGVYNSSNQWADNKP